MFEVEAPLRFLVPWRDSYDAHKLNHQSSVHLEQSVSQYLVTVSVSVSVSSTRVWIRISYHIGVGVTVSVSASVSVSINASTSSLVSLVVN